MFIFNCGPLIRIHRFHPIIHLGLPYNNKSDVWSIGCILYELTTLKKPFEGSSLNQLMIRILKGTYPPISSRYSENLSALITELLHRDSHKRPSINAILRKPFLQERIRKFLPEAQFHSEFSHTVLHGQIPKQVMTKPPGLQQDSGDVKLAKPGER